MAHLHNDYTVPGSTFQQSPQLELFVRCPNCASRFGVSFPGHFNNYPPTFNYHAQSFIQYPSRQNGVRSTFYPSTFPNSYVSGVNQQRKEMVDNIDRWQYVSHRAVDMDDTIVHRIRDVLIDILNSTICKYGITIPNLMLLLKRSCANYSIILPSSIMDDFEEFLRCEMPDYVEIQDDLCRYHRPTLSVREESVSSSSTCGKEANHSLATVMKCGIMPVVAANASSDQAEKIILEKEEMNKTISGQFFGGREEHHRNDGADKRIATDLVILGDEKKFDVLQKHIENDAVSEYSYTKDDLTKIMKKWKEIFVGDIKELIRYLRMVDNYFQERDGKFTLSEFKGVFGELNKRWEFSDIDLIEMDIINVVHSLDTEHVLIVNPVVREMEFPEMVELAKKIYNLLSKLLQSMNSVKIDVIVRTLNFGINDRKTIDEKYALLWEVFSDPQFQNVFFVDVLQKQNKGRGFDIMVRLNSNLNLPRISANLQF